MVTKLDDSNIHAEPRNTTVYDAVYEWNRQHSRKDQILSDEKNLSKLAKSIFLCYTQERGYFFEKVSRENRFFTFLTRVSRWMHLGYKRTRLEAAQKTAFKELQNTLQLASHSVVKDSPDEKAILAARLKVAYGPEFVKVYNLVMDPNAEANQSVMQQLVPKLRQIMEDAEARKYRMSLSAADAEVRELEAFKRKAKELIEQYVKIKKSKLQDETIIELRDLHEKVRQNIASPEERQRLSQLDSIFKTRNCFISFYAKVLDCVKFDPRIFGGLEGYSSINAIIDFQHDLVDFRDQNEKLLSSEEIQAINLAAKELSFAYVIATKSPIEAAASVIGKLEELAKIPKEKRRPIILRGGDSVHAVLYKIEMTESGKYNFSVIDTGAGITKINVSATYGVVYKMCDLQFSEIPGEQLSLDFFEHLFDLKERAENMSAVYDYLKSHLLVQGAKMGEGEERHIQQKDSCTIRCIHEWLRKEFTKDLFREFNAWMSLKSVKDVKKEAENISREALKWIFPGIEPEEETKEFYDENLQSLIRRGEVIAGQRALKAKRIKPFPT